MRKACLIVAGVLLGVGVAGAQTFTDVDSPQYHGWQELNEAVDANFALIESGGTIDASFEDVTVNSTLVAVSTNDATTNTVITVDGQVDGETLADDSVDSDAMDPTQTAIPRQRPPLRRPHRQRTFST